MMDAGGYNQVLTDALEGELAGLQQALKAQSEQFLHDPATITVGTLAMGAVATIGGLLNPAAAPIALPAGFAQLGIGLAYLTLLGLGQSNAIARSDEAASMALDLANPAVRSLTVLQLVVGNRDMKISLETSKAVNACYEMTASIFELLKNEGNPAKPFAAGYELVKSVREVRKESVSNHQSSSNQSPDKNGFPSNDRSSLRGVDPKIADMYHIEARFEEMRIRRSRLQAAAQAGEETRARIERELEQYRSDFRESRKRAEAAAKEFALRQTEEAKAAAEDARRAADWANIRLNDYQNARCSYRSGGGSSDPAEPTADDPGLQRPPPSSNFLP
jgi:hypothetical protein